MSKIDDFVPYRLFLFMLAQLNSISTAAGNNTDPFVSEDWHEAENSDAKHILFLEATGGGNDNQGVGGNPQVNPVYRFIVYGRVQYETEHGRRLAMALEQDVRNALHGAIGTVRDAAGRGASFRFGTCIHDGGLFAPEKEAHFNLSVSFTWSQSSNW